MSKGYSPGAAANNFDEKLLSSSALIEQAKYYEGMTEDLFGKVTQIGMHRFKRAALAMRIVASLIETRTVDVEALAKKVTMEKPEQRAA